MIFLVLTLMTFCGIPIGFIAGVIVAQRATRAQDDEPRPEDWGV